MRTDNHDDQDRQDDPALIHRRVSVLAERRVQTAEDGPVSLVPCGMGRTRWIV